MSTLRQPCPECGRTLELPADAVGRAAKCPACEAVFTITAPTEVVETADDEPAEPPASEATSPAEFSQASKPAPPPERSPSPEPSQPSSEVNPYSSPIDSGTVPGSIEGGPPERRPAQPVAHVGELAVVPRSIEEIFSPTISIFTARWAPLIVSFIVVLLAVLLVIVLPVVLLQALAEAGNPQLAGITLLVALPFIFLFSVATWVGLTRVAIAVARNDPSPLSELLPPIKVVWRLIVGMFALGLATLVVIGLFLAVVGGLTAANAPQPVVAIVGLLGVIALTVIVLIMQWLLWPWVYVVSDGKGTSIGSIRAAYVIVMHNKLTSLLLIVIATVMSMVGTTACYVGHLVTAPLTLLMFAVAYLLMTDQPIHDPKTMRQADQPPPPPNQPTF